MICFIDYRTSENEINSLINLYEEDFITVLPHNLFDS